MVRSLFISGLFLHGLCLGAPTLRELEHAFENQQWNDTAQFAEEILELHPNESIAKLRGAYALFNRNFPNSALLFLKKLTPSEWKQIPQGQDRFVEIVSLFQKKVPLNLLPGRLEQVNIEEASPALADEIRFAKGRAAYEAKKTDEAAGYLQAVGKGSRYYAQARYLMGCLALRRKDYRMAAAEFSHIFEPSVLEQSTEFWKDIGTQANSRWGTSLSVTLDSDAMTTTKRVGELALMGLARIQYAQKDYDDALRQYRRIPRNSPLFPRSHLEILWTLLQMNRHEDAQKEAMQLSLNDTLFEALEARTVRAVILVDAGRTKEAREEITNFLKIFEAASIALRNYQEVKIAESLPPFVRHDLNSDQRVANLIQYQTRLKQEIEELRAQDGRLYPIFQKLAGQLEPLVSEARTLIDHLQMEHVARRLVDLNRLQVQAKLILAETYLEDREKLRNEFKALAQPNEDLQKEHDKRLVELLTKAIAEVEEAMAKLPNGQSNLEFRHAELLWELSTAQFILAQTTNNKVNSALGENLRQKSLRIAEDISRNRKDFEKHAQALFFTGFAEMEVGNLELGIKTLVDYVKQYERHAHVPDAYRILGDLKFESNQFKAAEQYYQKILQFEDSMIIGYALYKIGWCAYNQREFAKALLALEKAILWATNTDKNNQLFTLKREARRDLIAIYAEVGDHRKALDYFQRFFHDQASSWILDLARQFDTTGQYEKSIELYRTLILMNPEDNDKLSYQTAIIRGVYKLHRWPMVLSAVKEMVQEHRNRLQRIQPDGHPAFFAEQVVREVVLAHHFEFNKIDSAEGLDRTLELDTLYLSAFDPWPTSQEPLYQHAHSLMRKKTPREAADAFRKHWLRFGPGLAEPLKEESLRNLIHALETVDSPEKGETVLLTPIAQEILNYTSDYLRAYPATKFTRAIAFLRTVILFKYEQVEKGIKETQVLFDQSPIDEFGKRAFKNLRFAYYKKNKWEETYRWATKMAARTELGMDSYAPDLRAIREETLFLWANGIEENAAAADLFMKIAQDPDMRRLREKSLYNAFIRLHRANQRIDALQIASQLEQSSPTYEGLAQIAGLRAALYQDAGDYASALPLLQHFLAKPDKDVTPEVLQQARLNAALIAEAIEKPDLAIGLFQEYIARSGQVLSPGIKQAQRRLSVLTRKEATRAPAAMSPYWPNLTKQRETFQGQPIPPGNDLALRIKNGAAKMETLAKQFFDIAANPDASPFQALESLCSVPFIYSAYSKALLALADEDPTLEGIEQLRAELSKIAQPIEFRVRELSDQCLKQSITAEHDGPQYRLVTETWGWASHADVKKKAEHLKELLDQGFPWMDALPLSRSEADLIQAHLKKGGDKDTWYSLAKIRFDSRNFGLARLSLVDARTRFSMDGRLLNGLAIFEERQGSNSRMTELYETAGKEGSKAAWANLARVHLSGWRFDESLLALRRAYENDVFDDSKELRTLVKEFLPK